MRISKRECFHKNKKKRSKQQKIRAEGLTFFHIRGKCNLDVAINCFIAYNYLVGD